MPQENQVVRCYSCLTFQVHLVKKQKKWQCKMCNSKQSLKQIYGKGSGKDCRLHVMKLNELQFSGDPVNAYDVNDVNEPDVEDDNPKTESITMNDIKNESKWSKYLNETDESSNEEEEINYKHMKTEVKFKGLSNNECSSMKKRKLNNDFPDSNFDLSFELTSTHNYQNNVETETGTKKHEEKLQKCDMPVYNGSFIKSGSKWSAFIDTEQYLSDEECKNETESVFISEKETSQNRCQYVPHQKSVNMENLDEGKREICPAYSEFLVNTHFEENPGLNGDKKCVTGNLKILKTLHDDDDLDEILSI